MKIMINNERMWLRLAESISCLAHGRSKHSKKRKEPVSLKWDQRRIAANLVEYTRRFETTFVLLESIQRRLTFEVQSMNPVTQFLGKMHFLYSSIFKTRAEPHD